jgi:hypothetical protein
VDVILFGGRIPFFCGVAWWVVVRSPITGDQASDLFWLCGGLQCHVPDLVELYICTQSDTLSVGVDSLEGSNAAPDVCVVFGG